MKKRFQLGLLYIGALALSLTLATAEGKCNNAQQGMMNQDAKCGDAKKEKKYMHEKREAYQKEMREKNGKCGANMKPKKEPEPAPMKGKCGQGKCG